MQHRACPAENSSDHHPPGQITETVPRIQKPIAARPNPQAATFDSKPVEKPFTGKTAELAQKGEQASRQDSYEDDNPDGTS